MYSFSVPERLYDDYNTAVTCLEKGDYETARGIFKNLLDYKDSRERVNEATYLAGVSRMQKGKYSRAIKYFEELDEKYRDTYIVKQQCQYEFLLQFFSADWVVPVHGNPSFVDIEKMINDVNKNGELAPLLAERIYSHAVEQLNKNQVAGSILYFEMTYRYITPGQDVLQKLYHYGRPLLEYFLMDFSSLSEYARKKKSIFLDKKYRNLDRIFSYLSVQNYLDTADWNQSLEQGSNFPFVQSNQSTAFSGKGNIVPYSCMVISDVLPISFMINLKTALAGNIYFTTDSNQAGFVVELKNNYKMAHSAVEYAGKVHADFYDTKSNSYVKNDAGKVLYDNSCLSRYGSPKSHINPEERSFSAGIMGGDECAGVTGDIVKIFKDFYGNK